MNTDAIIIGCVGLLFIVVNKPFGEAMSRAKFKFDGKETGVWPYRGGFIYLGLCFICWAALLMR